VEFTAEVIKALYTTTESTKRSVPICQNWSKYVNASLVCLHKPTAKKTQLNKKQSARTRGFWFVVGHSLLHANVTSGWIQNPNKEYQDTMLKRRVWQQKYK